MSKTLKQFIADTKGKQIAVPWGFKGQCVSLVQMYLHEVFGYPLHARGNAKDWEYTLVREGIAKKVTKPQYGDIIVYGANHGGGYGHIAIWLSPTTLYDQNNFSHSKGRAGVGAMIPNPRGYFRLDRPLPSEVDKAPEPTPTPTPDTELFVGTKVRWSGRLYRDSLGNGATGNYRERDGIVDIINSNKYGVHIRSMGWIAPSQITRVSDALYHTVVKGDTLFKIGQKYKVNWDVIYKNNKSIIGNDPNHIKVGMRLFIK